MSKNIIVLTSPAPCGAFLLKESLVKGNRKSTLRQLKRKNAVLGVVQIGQLSPKQLAIDKARWEETGAKMRRFWGLEGESSNSTMAEFATVI